MNLGCPHPHLFAQPNRAPKLVTRALDTVGFAKECCYFKLQHVRCRLVLDWKLTPTVYKYEKESDLHQSIYPEGFYDVRPSPQTLSCKPPLTASTALSSPVSCCTVAAAMPYCTLLLDGIGRCQSTSKW